MGGGRRDLACTPSPFLFSGRPAIGLLGLGLGLCERNGDGLGKKEEAS